MEIKTIRTVLVVSITLLVISEISRWIFLIGGSLGGLIGGMLIAAVYIYCGSKAKAGKKYSVWILVPTITFTIIPIIVKVWNYFTDQEASLIQRLWEYGPFLISFVLPVVLLLLAYVELGKHQEDVLLE